MQYPILSRALATAALLLATAAQAGTFGVSPLRLDLGGHARTSVITVTNDGTAPLQLEVHAVAWTTGPDGNEQYAPTEDLAVYPPGLIVPPGQKRVVRVGIDGDGGRPEKSYRVFLKETPAEGAARARGAQVSMLVNFGVPVFVSGKPTSAQLEGKASSSAGGAELQVRNVGDGHTRIDELSLAGKPRPVASPYVLAGASRVFRFPVTPEDCARGPAQEVQLRLQDESVVKFPIDLSAACKQG